jgi:hypothetical protein
MVYLSVYLIGEVTELGHAVGDRGDPAGPGLS